MIYGTTGCSVATVANLHKSNESHLAFHCEKQWCERVSVRSVSIWSLSHVVMAVSNIVAGNWEADENEWLNFYTVSCDLHNCICRLCSCRQQYCLFQSRRLPGYSAQRPMTRLWVFRRQEGLICQTVQSHDAAFVRHVGSAVSLILCDWQVGANIVTFGETDATSGLFKTLAVWLRVQILQTWTRKEPRRKLLPFLRFHGVNAKSICGLIVIYDLW